MLPSFFSTTLQKPEHRKKHHSCLAGQSHPFPEVLEPGIRTQTIKCRIHPDEKDVLGMFIIKQFQPFDSFLFVAKRRMNERQIVCRKVLLDSFLIEDFQYPECLASVSRSSVGVGKQGAVFQEATGKVDCFLKLMDSLQVHSFLDIYLTERFVGQDKIRI